MYLKFAINICIMITTIIVSTTERSAEKGDVLLREEAIYKAGADLPGAASGDIAMRLHLSKSVV